MSIFYNKSGDFIEIIVRDSTLKKIGSWKFNTADRDLAAGIFKHLESKYGFVPTIKPSENVPVKKEESKPELDIWGFPKEKSIW